MDREELKGRQTPGKIALLDHKDGGVMIYPDTGSCAYMAILPHDDEEDKANAALYAEAHNVANESGYWPKDLLERVRELEKELQVARLCLNGIDDHNETTQKQMAR